MHFEDFIRVKKNLQYFWGRWVGGLQLEQKAFAHSDIASETLSFLSAGFVPPPSCSWLPVWRCDVTWRGLMVSVWDHGVWGSECCNTGELVMYRGETGPVCILATKKIGKDGGNFATSEVIFFTLKYLWVFTFAFLLVVAQEILIW